MPIDSHFEYVASIDQSLKQHVYSSMDQLEGWCSKEKATVLMELIDANKPQIIVEIGVFGGKSLIPMAFALKQNGSGITYGIDPWTPVASVAGLDPVNGNWWAKVDHEGILQGLRLKIREFDLEKQVKLIRSTSADALPIHHIDMLHVDGNHSEDASFLDVTKWVPMVRKGGLIILDDITWGATEKFPGTTAKAVKWVDDRCTKLAEYKGDNVWGVWLKTW